MTTRVCPVCSSEVPAVRFCGDCGADLDATVSRWSVLLRPRVFATAHRESVWLPPRISSTLFPRVPGEMRKPFRVALILVLIAMVVLGMLRVNGPLGVVSIIGWPLIFLIYVWETDVFQDLPARILLAAMVIGIALGVGWWLSTGKLLAGSYGVSTGSSLLLLRVLNVGLFISLGGALLMLVPAFVTRLFRVPVRESLDGFVVGAFGALWYSTAATTTVLAPQFVEGLMEDQSAARLLESSITFGIVNMVITTAAGGLVGLSLWFTPNDRDTKRSRGAVIMCAVLAVATGMAVWVVDALELSRAVDLVLKGALAVLAVVIVRCGVQIALLHEMPDPATGAPVLCVHCEQVVPDMAFCPACGAAARASSRTSRRLRHEYPPDQVPVAAL